MEPLSPQLSSVSSSSEKDLSVQPNKADSIASKHELNVSKDSLSSSSPNPVEYESISSPSAKQPRLRSLSMGDIGVAKGIIAHKDDVVSRQEKMHVPYDDPGIKLEDIERQDITQKDLNRLGVDVSEKLIGTRNYMTLGTKNPQESVYDDSNFAAEFGARKPWVDDDGDFEEFTQVIEDTAKKLDPNAKVGTVMSFEHNKFGEEYLRSAAASATSIHFTLDLLADTKKYLDENGGTLGNFEGGFVTARELTLIMGNDELRDKTVFHVLENPLSAEYVLEPSINQAAIDNIFQEIESNEDDTVFQKYSQFSEKVIAASHSVHMASVTSGDERKEVLIGIVKDLQTSVDDIDEFGANNINAMVDKLLEASDVTDLQKIAADMRAEAMRYAIVVGDIISNVYESYPRPSGKEEVVMTTADWAADLVGQSLSSDEMKDNIISRLSDTYMQMLSEKNAEVMSEFDTVFKSELASHLDKEDLQAVNQLLNGYLYTMKFI